jgi:glycosyltransferase involved in cell wall biosynthesis
MPKISVIIPIYDTEQYLAGCIDSVLAQTYTDFELILVDDGSPDRCPTICDEYAVKDSRVRVFHKKNGGVSTARNLGLDNAQGEFICFIDSDDTVGSNYLMNLAPRGDEDFIQGGVGVLENDYLKQYMTHEDIFKDYNQFWMQSRQQWSPKCCLSKAVIDKWHIRYDTSLRMGEDGLFNHIFLSKCQLIRRMKEDDYYYNHDNEASASHKYYPDRLEQQIQLVKRLEHYFADDDIQRVRWDYWKEVLNHYRVKGIHNSVPAIRKDARDAIKETYRTECFRKCLPYIKKNGSLDEKIEAIYMYYYVHWMYRHILSIIQVGNKVKHFVKKC